MTKKQETHQEREDRQKAEQQAFISGLKVGDEFAVPNTSRFGGGVTIRTVARLTKTQIICNSGLRFWIDRGTPVGGSYYSRIRAITQEDRDDIERREIMYKFASVKFDKLDLATLRRLNDAYELSIAEQVPA